MATARLGTWAYCDMLCLFVYLFVFCIFSARTIVYNMQYNVTLYTHSFTHPLDHSLTYLLTHSSDAKRSCQNFKCDTRHFLSMIKIKSYLKNYRLKDQWSIRIMERNNRLHFQRLSVVKRRRGTNASRSRCWCSETPVEWNVKPASRMRKGPS